MLGVVKEEMVNISIGGKGEGLSMQAVLSAATKHFSQRRKAFYEFHPSMLQRSKKWRSNPSTI